MKISAEVEPESPASYALSGYSRRIHRFYEVLLPEEFRPGTCNPILESAFGAYLDPTVRPFPSGCRSTR